MKPLYWIGSSKKDLQRLPQEIQEIFGYALYLAQIGGKHSHSRSLKGFGCAGVIQIIEDYFSNTYRAIYTVKFGESVYVLHAFQKKSSMGISTPKPDIEKVRERLKIAEHHAKGV